MLNLLARSLTAICFAAFVQTALSVPLPLLPGDLVASVNEFTGSSNAPRYLAEYTTAGVRRQTFSAVPEPGGTTATTDTLRDVTVGPGNALYLYNGTFTPTLTRFDLQTSVYTQQTTAGFSTVNNTTYGGLAQLGGRYLLATDMNTANGGEAQGIVRFDSLGGAPVRFATTIAPLDVNVGADGLIYALDGSGSPNSEVFKYDPNTLALLAVVPIGFEDNRAVAVTADGTIFVATGGGIIRHYSAAGVLTNSLTVSGAFFGDMDINPSGKIALGTAQSGEVVLTDTNLTTFTRYRATTSTQGGAVFVSWISVPEPGAVTLLAMGIGSGAIASWRRKRSRAW